MRERTVPSLAPRISPTKRPSTSLLNPTASCDHPLERNVALAQRLGVQGTPTLLWADGSRTDGYVDRGVLETRLAQVARGRP